MGEENTIALSVRNVSKSYGSVKVLDNISVDVAEKEMLVLLGPSGCGKTTLLKIIAGLLSHETGELFIQGENVTNKPPYKRDIGLVFQNYALFPHKTVFENVAYGLKMRHVEKNEIKRRVKEVLALVRLEGMENRSTKQMSGGQQQRVALARALVLNPSLLLLDEPLSNLDAKLRAIVRVEIAQIQRKLGLTSILVTHDQTEALTMGDRIILMYEGTIKQEGSPQEIFDKPRDIFVASFIGSPQINLFDAEFNSGLLSFSNIHGQPFDRNQLKISIAADISDQIKEGQKVVIGIRPENFNIHFSDIESCMIKGHINFIENLGSDFYIHILSNEKEIIARLPMEYKNQAIVGAEVGLNCKDGEMHLFDMETTERISK